MYDKFINMRFLRKIKVLFSKSDNLFEEVLIPLMPNSLRFNIFESRKIMQNPEWHPEGDVYTHSKIVTNRCHKNFRNINLILAGVFHDLGKIDVTVFNEEKNTFSAHGHEELSLMYIEQNIKWIKWMGGNPKKISYIVKNHMRIKFMDEMKPKKRKNFMKEKWFHLVEKFATCDKGGF